LDATKSIRVKNEPFYGLTPFQSDCGWWGVGASEELKCLAARMDATEPMRVKNEPFYGLTPFSIH
jgi:hypothetical protein